MNQADLIIQIALAQDGYLEKTSNSNLFDKTANAGYNNYTMFGKWYQDNVDGSYSFINAAWCDMFKTWCANQAGITSTQIPYTAKCSAGVNWFKRQGLWQAANGYTPKKGDVIYYKNNNGEAYHVGLVVRVSGGTVYTIEGNTSRASGVVENGGGVAQKSYKLTYNKILGYGTPKYIDIMTDDEIKSLIKLKAQPIITNEVNKYFENRKGIKVLSPWAKEDRKSVV